MTYEETVGRNIGLLTWQDQEKIRGTSVAVIGLGGVGSWASVLVAKTGFGHIVVVDKDRYELPNIVEQMMATTKTLGRLKAEVVKEEATLHGPFAKIEGIVKDIQSVEDAIEVSQGADYVICTVDDPVARVLVDRSSRKLGITTLMAANIGWRIINSIHIPTEMSYEEHTHQISLGKSLTPQIISSLHTQQRVFVACAGGFTPQYAEKYLKGDVSYISYLGAPSAFAASVAVNDLIKLVTGRGKPRIAPDYLAFDLLEMDHLDFGQVGLKTYRVIQAIMAKGIEEGVKIWKEVMGYR